MQDVSTDDRGQRQRQQWLEMTSTRGTSAFAEDECQDANAEDVLQLELKRY